MAKTTTRTRVDPLQGTLDMLILRTLRFGPQHGWTILTKAIARGLGPA